MRDIDLFQLALNLTPPWEVVSVDFNADKKRLDILLDFPKGSVFSCPECDRSDCTAYDTTQKTWRHLNFFQHEAYLSARVPRVNCKDCGAKKVGVSWARPDSGFTLLFEAMIMSMVTAMPVKAVARLVGEQDTRLWRLLNHYVDKARDQLDLSQVKRVGIDETSGKKGHNYVSVFVDLDTPKVIYATEGKGADTVKRFSEDFAEHDGKPDAVEESCCDMSPAFISGIGQYLPKSQITFDKFHVMKIIINAVDEVRRQEQKNHPELKKTRYTWLKNTDKFKKNQSKQLEELKIPKLNLKTARAYHIKLNFQEFWTQTPENAEAFLKKWYFWATHSRLEPVKQAAYTVKRHWDGILRWFHSHINNGILEGINSLIQAAKAKARGYRSSRNYITMIYLIAGKLDYTLPT